VTVSLVRSTVTLVLVGLFAPVFPLGATPAAGAEACLPGPGDPCVETGPVTEFADHASAAVVQITTDLVNLCAGSQCSEQLESAVQMAVAELESEGGDEIETSFEMTGVILALTGTIIDNNLRNVAHDFCDDPACESAAAAAVAAEQSVLILATAHHRYSHTLIANCLEVCSRRLEVVETPLSAFYATGADQALIDAARLAASATAGAAHLLNAELEQSPTMVREQVEDVARAALDAVGLLDDTLISTEASLPAAVKTLIAEARRTLVETVVRIPTAEVASFELVDRVRAEKLQQFEDSLLVVSSAALLVYHLFGVQELELNPAGPYYYAVLDQVDVLARPTLAWMAGAHDETTAEAGLEPITSSTCYPTIGGIVGGQANEYPPQGENPCSKYLGDFGEMGPNEQRVCLQWGYDCIRAKDSAKNAYEHQNARYPGYDAHNTRVDAFRHCQWTALMTKRATPDFAERMGRAHEDDNDQQSGQPPREREMDLHNNGWGVHAGLETEGKSDGSTASLCVKYVDLRLLDWTKDLPDDPPPR
jgi:hypothetical protein